MEDHKRLLLPAITAIVLHGFLISLQLPKHKPVKPTLIDNPIRIEINAFSSKAPVQQKNQADKPAQTIPAVAPQEKIGQKKVSAQPINLQRQRQKIPVKPDLTKKSVVTQQPRPIEKQVTTMAGSSPVPAVAPGKKNNGAMKKDRPQGATSAIPVLQKAIPMYRQNKQPLYPAMAKRRGYEGEILLNVLVNPEGKVALIKIQRSSNHQSLDTAALEAVKNWLFVPATDGGRPFSMWVTVPIEFRLQTNGKG